MLKKALLLLFFCIAFYPKAIPEPNKPDSLLRILQISDNYREESALVDYIRLRFGGKTDTDFTRDKANLDQLFIKYNVKNRQAIDYFMESIYQGQLLHISDAENDLVKAIDIADKEPDHYLLYEFFSQLAFMQTYEGNTIEAVASFRIAKKEAVTLDDPHPEIYIDINISDIFYRNDFYNQSLFYLDEAYSILNKHHLNEPRLDNIINFNKCENYFRMKEADSLRKYNEKLNSAKHGTYKLYMYRNRTDYYLYLLHHEYKKAAKRILALQKDTLYRFTNIDKQNLADAYYNAGMPDSAKYIIGELLADKALNNHPEIKYHLYDVLGKINKEQNNQKQAAINFEEALQQSEDNISRLTQVGNISSQIKIDAMENSYMQKDEMYKRERVWLSFIVIVAVLTIAVIAISYRNIKQRRHYERLLFAAKREELAIINSHAIRKHLTNILGIIDVIRHSDNHAQEYLQVEDRLLYSAEELDKEIKNIAQKLDE